MYEGIADCANQFAMQNSKNENNFFAANNQTEEAAIDSARIDEIIKSDTLGSESNIKAKKKPISNVGVTYVSGDKVQMGFQLTYQSFDTTSTNKSFLKGFGYSFTVYNVANHPAFIEGNFISFNYRYAMRYFLDPSLKGIYFGGSIRLSFGSERIAYGYREDTNYFFGPTFEEIIGVSINKKIFIEGGLFQIRHFGSDLLPDDLGFTLGLNFRL